MVWIDTVRIRQNCVWVGEKRSCWIFLNHHDWKGSSFNRVCYLWPFLSIITTTSSSACTLVQELNEILSWFWKWLELSYPTYCLSSNFRPLYPAHADHFWKITSTTPLLICSQTNDSSSRDQRTIHNRCPDKRNRMQLSRMGSFSVWLDHRAWQKSIENKSEEMSWDQLMRSLVRNLGLNQRTIWSCQNAWDKDLNVQFCISDRPFWLQFQNEH